jgi:hypothetical protein
LIAQFLRRRCSTTPKAASSPLAWQGKKRADYLAEAGIEVVVKAWRA